MKTRLSQHNLKSVFKVFSIPLALALWLLCGCSAPEKQPLPYAQELQEVLDTARESAGLIGASTAIIVPGFETWLGVSGESHPGVPITTDTLFDMGSAGKIIMGPLMVKLAEEGLIALDDPIQVYLPDFPYVDGLISIRQLLNHTSGLFMMVKHTDSPFRKPYNEINHQRWWTIDEIFTELGGSPYFPPGEGWCYTQAGYQISSLIVETVTGGTVAQAVRTYLLDPIEIDGMLLDSTNPPSDQPEIAHPWVDVDYDGDYEDVHADSRNWIASLSRILFYTNPADFAVWGHALFSGEALKPESLAVILDFYRMEDLCGEPPVLTGYGLGVQDFDPALTRGQQAWGHLGSIQGYRTILAHIPEYGVTFVIMTNTDSDEALLLVDAVLNELLKHLDEDSQRSPVIQLEPQIQPPAGVPVLDTFQKDALFCDHNPQWELQAGAEDWINLSLEWVVGTDADKAVNAWEHHQHTITVNGETIPNPESFSHDLAHYTVHCPDETLEIWAKGLSIYLPPLPEGEYEIIWHSQITGQFDNGWVVYQPGNFMEITASLEITGEDQNGSN